MLQRKLYDDDVESEDEDDELIIRNSVRSMSEAAAEADGDDEVEEFAEEDVDHD